MKYLYHKSFIISRKVTYQQFLACYWKTFKNITYYSYWYPRKKISFEIYINHTTKLFNILLGVLSWNLENSGDARGKSETYKVFQNFQSNIVTKRVRVSLKEKHSTLAKKMLKAHVMVLATSAFYFFGFIARLYSTKAPASYVTPLKKYFPGDFLGQFFCKCFSV